MATLTGQSIASSYEQLLHTDTDGGGNGATLVPIKDGDNGTTFSLELATTSIAIGATHKLYLDGGGNTYITESSADTIQLATGGTTRMIIDGSGVGIGTGATTPSHPLHVATGNDNGLIAEFQNTEDTDDRCFGVRIKAGSTSTDYALSLIHI